VGDLFSILFDVLAPVFLVVAAGYVVGRRFDLDPRPTARIAYYVLVPAFVFEVLRASDLAGETVVRMLGVLVVTTVAVAGVAWLVGRGMGRTRSIIVAFVLVAVFGNVGNVGLAVTIFEFGEDAADLAGVAFLTVNVLAFLIAITAIRWGDEHPLRAFGAALATPAVLAVPPAILANATGSELPVFLDRMVGILAEGLIPIMLLTLGLQLAATTQLRLDADVVAATGLRLIAAPVIAAVAAALAGLDGDAAGVTIVMSAMPAAVFAGIVAIEHDLEPEMVTTAVLVSTLASVATLAVVLAVV
jgi:predicted permease